VSVKRWKTLERSKLSSAALERVRTRARQEVEEVSLKALREELEITQSELSRSADMTQSELSRVESRDDHLTSTLRRYVEALGGDLEITAVIGKRRIKLGKV
jgi:predicted transcriptional regulator